MEVCSALHLLLPEAKLYGVAPSLAVGSDLKTGYWTCRLCLLCLDMLTMLT